MILRVDVDAPRPVPLVELIDRLRRASRRLVWLSQVRSPGGKGWHLEACVTPRPRSAMEVVALQLLLGSDPHREAYNVNRARHVDAGHVPPFWRSPAAWNVLYQTSGGKKYGTT